MQHARRTTPVRRSAAVAVAAAFAAAAAAVPAHGQTPIPERASSAPAFIGAPATPQAVAAPPPPRHPHMAANGSSNLHEDAWQTDTTWRAGPLGRGLVRASTLHLRECGSVTFDSRGRIVTVCVGADRPQLVLMDPRTLASIATHDLPPREPSTDSPLTEFAGGGYFYLDDRDRAVIPTMSRHVVTVAVQGDRLVPVGDHDLTSVVPRGDAIISALPDWSGRLWFATRDGILGTIGRDGAPHRATKLEPIGNSFAVGEAGEVYVVTDGALYRLEAAPDGTPVVRWRRPYENVGAIKPGQTQAGSGTTPTVLARGLVAITDNADPMHVVVFRRVDGAQLCRVPVFEAGRSSTDQSLIAAGRSLIAENNHGYGGPTATTLGGTTTAGLERVDVAEDLRSCRKVWRSDETAPSVVPKLSLSNGLVYTYTKPGGDRSDPWYLTALDFRTGRTVFKARAGGGSGFNNHYAPITIGPDGTLYVGTLGGLVALRDEVAPAQPGGRPQPRLRLVVRWCRGRRAARVTGPDTDWVTRVVVRRRGRRAVARVTLTDGRAIRLRARAPHRCRPGASGDGRRPPVRRR